MLLNMQVGSLKMQAKREIKKKFSDPRIQGGIV